MATTKKSTKAKVKTTKKPAAKATAARAAKTTKKSVSTKAVKAPAKAVASATGSPVKTLLIISVILSLAGAVLAGFFMKNTDYQLVSGLMAKNELAGADASGLVPAVKHVVDLNLRWVVVAIMSLGALFPLLFLTIYKDRFNNALRTRKNVLRWIDTAVIGALMIEVVALLSGINNVTILKLMGLLVAVSCALAWVSEKRAVQAGRPVKSELWLGMIVGLLPWIVIACSAINTVIFGNLTSPWYVYALYAVLLPGTIGYFSTLRSFVSGKTTAEAAEKGYASLGILIKVAFVAILIAGSYVS